MRGDLKNKHLDEKSSEIGLKSPGQSQVSVRNKKSKFREENKTLKMKVLLVTALVLIKVILKCRGFEVDSRWGSGQASLLFNQAQ